MVHLCAYAYVSNENQPKDHWSYFDFQVLFIYLFDQIARGIPIDITDAPDPDGITEGN